MGALFKMGLSFFYGLYCKNPWKTAIGWITGSLSISFALVNWLYPSETCSYVFKVHEQLNCRLMQTGLVLFITSLATILLLVLIINWHRTTKKARLISKVDEALADNIVKTRTLRIFASKAETAKQKILSMQGVEFTQPLNIKVLLRDENGGKRRKTLDDQIDCWKNDIDLGLTQKYGNNIVTTFAIYTHPVMLRGFIFDSKLAMFSWYSRFPTTSGRHRSRPDLPYVAIFDDCQESKELIEDAIKVFDCHFSAGAIP